MTESLIPLSHSITIAEGSNLAGFKSGKAEGLTEGSTNGVMVGLVLGAVFVGALVLYSISRSNVERIAVAGAVAPTPQTRSTVTPATAQSVAAQSVTADSSRSGWGS